MPDPSRIRVSAGAADPTLARFVLLESLAAGGEVAARHRASLRCFAALLRPADPAADDAQRWPAKPPPRHFLAASRTVAIPPRERHVVAILESDPFLSKTKTCI